MTDPHDPDDDLLRSLFADLARDDVRRVPTFAPPRARKARPLWPLALLPAAAVFAAAAAAITFVVLPSLLHSRDRSSARTLTGIVEPEPLAFLLGRPRSLGETR